MNEEPEVRLRVIYGDNMLYASNAELGIFARGENIGSLMENICEAIACHFGARSPDTVRITLDIDPAAISDIHVALC